MTSGCLLTNAHQEQKFLQQGKGKIQGSLHFGVFFFHLKAAFSNSHVELHSSGLR